MMIPWMKAFFAIARGSLPHNHGQFVVVAVVLHQGQEGGQDNPEGKLDRRGRDGVFGVQ